MAIRLITDTSCDLNQNILDEYGIIALPLIIMEGEKEYRDTVDIDIATVYHKMREGIFYHTAQTPLTDIRKAFLDAAKAGDDVLFMPLSAGISGTCQTARLLAEDVMEEYPERKIIVWDTKGTTVGLGLNVLEVAKSLKEGKSLEEVLDYLTFLTFHRQYVVTVEDIEYLHRGGRVNGIEKVLGNFLQIKPILHLDREGRLVPLGKARGRIKSIQRLTEIAEERSFDKEYLKNHVIGIFHADAPEDAMELRRMMEENCGAKNFYFHTMGATVGVHAGPGMVGVCFLDKQYTGYGDGKNIKEEDLRK